MSATSTSVVSVIRKVPVFLEAIKIEHAAFTLPFAYLAMLLGSGWLADAVAVHLGLGSHDRGQDGGHVAQSHHRPSPRQP